MSFFALLVLLSLIVIIPVVFVIKEKGKQSQADATRRHQEYLATVKPVNPKILSTTNTASSRDNPHHTIRPSHTNPCTIIEFTAQHPFVQRLYDNQLPIAFREIMDDIGQQYERTHHQHLTESQLFTLNKLIDTRIPELLDDYLSLDPDYATTTIIETTKTSTSYDMVLEQLHSILVFTQKIKAQSQGGVVDKLLASRRYLDEVAKNSGMNDDILKIK